MKNQKGFSLVELLVVVIIIAIIAAIAIPNLLASRRASNEASAISSLRTIHSAEVTYYSAFGGNANYTTIQGLAAANVDLIDDVLGAATSQKSGYEFSSSTGTNLYCAEANPIVETGVTRTGERRFGVEADGIVWAHPTATLSCSAGDLTTTGATPIQ